MKRVLSEAESLVVSISKGGFYRYPVTSSIQPNPPYFKELEMKIPVEKEKHWYIVGPSLSGKTTLLNVLRGQLLTTEPMTRRFPSLSPNYPIKSLKGRRRSPREAIRYVGFGNDEFGSNVTTSAYLSARYESKRENTDFSLRNYLLGNTQLNPFKKDPEDIPDPALLDKVASQLRLTELLDLPVAFLSNGQGRRARIAQALLTSPEILLLDEPFMGLDPRAVTSLSTLLYEMARVQSPRLVLTGRPQDPIPSWITDLIYLQTDCQIGVIGRKSIVLDRLREYAKKASGGDRCKTGSVKMLVQHISQMGRELTPEGIRGQTLLATIASNPNLATDTIDSSMMQVSEHAGKPLVEMDGCQVQYKGGIALGNWKQKVGGKDKAGLIWTVRTGERWGVFGPNGSGKTTLISLVCSDHPQTYSMPIKLFGRARLPEPDSNELPLTYWDISSRIGHSSPEIHSHMPRNLTVRQVIENAWADTFKSKPKLDDKAQVVVEETLKWFAPELNRDYKAPESKEEANLAELQAQSRDFSWADKYMFGELSHSAQRVALFLRAIVKKPEIVVLDEAFSGLDQVVRDKCLLYLEYGNTKELVKCPNGSMTIVNHSPGEINKIWGLTPKQALICISHLREEIPQCVREWVCLPEPNSGDAPRFGVSDAPLSHDEGSWREIWGM
ncbi:P-loop containing nucleoside triphosphate hydrolase protein [Xylariaceae sp. FL0016]|nr:P-loop containing nucleoside triphosphate hydrolase protein [Xylariaceae sp. FL0016]